MEAEFEGGWPEVRRRRLTIYTGIPALVATLCGVLGPFVVDVAGLSNLVLVGGLWLILSTVLGGRHTYRVTPAGLVREGRLRDRRTAWETLEGFEETDDGILLHRRGRRPPIEGELDDGTREAVVDALAEHLPRR